MTSDPLTRWLLPALGQAPLAAQLAAAGALPEDFSAHAALAARADVPADALAALAARWPDGPFAVASAALARGGRRGQVRGPMEWRWQLATCPRTPEPTLTALLADPSPFVVAGLVRNPGTHSAARARALLALDAAAAHGGVNETADLLWQLAYDEPLRGDPDRARTGSPAPELLWPQAPLDGLLHPADADRVAVAATDDATRRVAARSPLTGRGIRALAGHVTGTARSGRGDRARAAELTRWLASAPALDAATRAELVGVWSTAPDWHDDLALLPTPTRAELVGALRAPAAAPAPRAAASGKGQRPRTRAAAAALLLARCGADPALWRLVAELRPAPDATLGAVLTTLDAVLAAAG